MDAAALIVDLGQLLQLVIAVGVHLGQSGTSWPRSTISASMDGLVPVTCVQGMLDHVDTVKRQQLFLDVHLKADRPKSLPWIQHATYLNEACMTLLRLATGYHSIGFA
jgi:hypothetical protein